MDPIPVFFEKVQRSALIIRPKKPFKDWLVSLDPEDVNYELSKAIDIYLIPDFEDEKNADKWLNENYEDIFCDQMNNWYTDESDWIQNRTFAMFKEWFDYTIHLMILDTLDKPIKKTL